MFFDPTLHCSDQVGMVVAVYASPGIVIELGNVPPVVTLSCTAPAKVNPTPVELPINAAHALVQLVVIAR
jgi:hypothetical protein